MNRFGCAWVSAAAILQVALMFSASRAEVIVVPATGTAASSSALTSGVTYDFTVSGTYNWGIIYHSDAFADAEYSHESGTWKEVYPGFTLATDTLDLLINMTAVDWLGSNDSGVTWAPHTFSPDHIYKFDYVGTGSSVLFSIADQTPFGPAYYSDNIGSLVVTITAESSPVPEPSTLAALSGLGVMGLIGIWRKRKRTA